MQYKSSFSLLSIGKQLLLSISVCLLVGLQLKAQDINISQTFAAPLLLNPALTGGYNGNFRISMLYRDQWASMIDDPYKSFLLSGDARIAIGQRATNGDYVGVGVLIVSDKVSQFNFSTNSIQLNGAFHKRLGRGSVNYLSAGLQLGLSQKNFSYENFTFQDEFNGVDGYSFPTREQFPANNFAHFDLSLGLNYSTELNSRLSIEAGAAAYHLLEPNISFYKDIDVSMSDLNNENGLKSRYVGHVSAQIKQSNELSFTPRFVFSTQGSHQQFMVGSGVRNEINDVKEVALHAGVWGRFTHDIDALAFRDLVMMVGVEFQSVIFGLSYDLSFDDLTTYQAGQHSFEFSIRYTGNYEDEGSYCPQF